MKKRPSTDTRLNVPISPLIDVVFLLLIFFMVTATLVKKEGDIAFALPSRGFPNGLPIEVFVEIAADGSIELEGMRFSRDDESLEGLVAQVEGLKQIAVSQHAEFFVNLLPHQNARHGRIIDVMDACAAAGVDHLGFSKSI